MGFLTHVKMLALDVDGVLTDGIISTARRATP